MKKTRKIIKISRKRKRSDVRASDYPNKRIRCGYWIINEETGEEEILCRNCIECTRCVECTDCGECEKFNGMTEEEKIEKLNMDLDDHRHESTKCDGCGASDGKTLENDIEFKTDMELENDHICRGDHLLNVWEYLEDSLKKYRDSMCIYDIHMSEEEIRKPAEHNRVLQKDLKEKISAYLQSKL